MLELIHITKTFNPGTVNAKTALDDISLSVPDGDFITIIGANGAGKSTMLNAVSGNFYTDSGTILLDGQCVSSMGERELTQYRRHDIGFVFQFYNLVQNLTALENVELASQICNDPLPAEQRH